MYFSPFVPVLAFIGLTTARIPVHPSGALNHHTVTGPFLPALNTNVVSHHPPGKRETTITSLDYAFVTETARVPGRVVGARPNEVPPAAVGPKPKIADVADCSVVTVTETVTDTVTTTFGFVQSSPIQSKPTPTPVAGSVMNHLKGLPWQYQHCFHNEEQAAARASTFHAKFTYPIAEWCKGGWEANGGISPAVWIERNIVPCVDFYFSGPEYFKKSADRTKVKNWLEKLCGAKEFKLDPE